MFGKACRSDTSSALVGQVLPCLMLTKAVDVHD